MKKDEILEYIEKKMYIDELGKVLVRYHKNIVNVKLDIFIDYKGNIQEFLVVTYRGGAMAVRDCAINSNYANYLELGNLIMGGYYDEVDYYHSLKAEENTEISDLLFGPTTKKEENE